MHEALRFFRSSANLSVAQAARLLGVTRATIYAWESGVKAPDPHRIPDICTAYGLTGDDGAKLAMLRCRPIASPTEAP